LRWYGIALLHGDERCRLRARELFHDEFERVGGLDALLGSDDFEFVADVSLDPSIEEVWRPVGRLLRLLQTMERCHPDARPGGASANKAVHLMEQFPEDHARMGRRQLLQLWAEFRPVAHLYCAYFDVQKLRRRPTDELWNWEDTPLLLAIARKHQDFLSCHRVHGGQKLADSVWRVPSSFAAPAAPDLEFAPLPTEQLVFLRSYRAPQEAL
jgi:hypothetical protein